MYLRCSSLSRCSTQLLNNRYTCCTKVDTGSTQMAKWLNLYIFSKRGICVVSLCHKTKYVLSFLANQDRIMP